MTPEDFATFGLLGLAGLCVLYVVPSIVAFRRAHPNRWAILAVNVFLGTTGIGWGVALVWALHAVHRSGEAGGSHGGASGLNVFADDARRVRLVEGHGAPQGGSGPPLTTAAAVAEIERLGRLRRRAPQRGQVHHAESNRARSGLNDAYGRKSPHFFQRLQERSGPLLWLARPSR